MWRGRGDECGGEGEMSVEGKGRRVWRGKGDECGGEGETSVEGKGR